MTEALDHYLDQRDEDYERQGETTMSRLSDDEKRYLTDQITMLKGENERLTKYIEDYEDDTRKVMEEKCATDEVHCTCVPALRKENEGLREMVMYCLRGHYVTEESGNEAHEIFPEYSGMIDTLLADTKEEVK